MTDGASEYRGFIDLAAGPATTARLHRSVGGYRWWIWGFTGFGGSGFRLLRLVY